MQQGTMVTLEKLYLVNLGSMTEVPAGLEFLMPLQYLGFREITCDFLTSLRHSRLAAMQWYYTLRD